MQAGAFNLDEQSHPAWLERADRAIDLLVDHFGDRSITVSDLGCGDQKLRTAIQHRGLPIVCLGYDLLPQTDEVLRLDLRTETPGGQVDATVILGVFKYLDDIEPILRRLADHAPVMVVSYLVSDSGAYSDDDVRKRGWRHHLSTAQFEELLINAGWGLEKSVLVAKKRTRLWCVRRNAAQREDLEPSAP